MRVLAMLLVLLLWGFAPPGWDNLIRHLGQTPDGMERLRLSGMISEPEPNKTYDRFRDRIMFPIRNHRGQTIAFGGRGLAKPDGFAEIGPGNVLANLLKKGIFSENDTCPVATVNSAQALDTFLAAATA